MCSAFCPVWSSVGHHMKTINSDPYPGGLFMSHSQISKGQEKKRRREEKAGGFTLKKGLQLKDPRTVKPALKLNHNQSWDYI